MIGLLVILLLGLGALYIDWRLNIKPDLEEQERDQEVIEYRRQRGDLWR